MAHLKQIHLAWMLVVLLATLTSNTAGAMSSPSLACRSWTIVPSPNPASYFNRLDAVAAVSPKDVWAVGYDYASGGPIQSLIEHWDGSRWQVISSPNADASALGAVTAFSASNVWAVGYRGSGTLIEHWDGAQWSIVPSPSVGSYLNSLHSVSALSPSDVWAVGADELGSGTPFQTLSEHWDGRRWRIVPSPNVGNDDTSLQGVSTLSPTDVWAVGDYSSSQEPYVARPLSQHWDGQRWKIIHPPSSNGSTFIGVAAVNANQLWAVGHSGATDGTLIEGWNGSHWRIVKSPGLIPSRLGGVAVRTSKDVWTVGTAYNVTLTEHWDGMSWQVVPSPNVSGQDNYLNGVAVVSAHGVWAVGYTQPHNGYSSKTLIEYYC